MCCTGKSRWRCKHNVPRAWDCQQEYEPQEAVLLWVQQPFSILTLSVHMDASQSVSVVSLNVLDTCAWTDPLHQIHYIHTYLCLYIYIYIYIKLHVLDTCAWTFCTHGCKSVCVVSLNVRDTCAWTHYLHHIHRIHTYLCLSLCIYIYIYIKLDVLDSCEWIQHSHQIHHIYSLYTAYDKAHWHSAT
jgi:hypothetical protein